jgi:hypothetical protein
VQPKRSTWDASDARGIEAEIYEVVAGERRRLVG